MLKLMAGAVVGMVVALVIVSFFGIENEFLKGVAVIVGAIWGATKI